MTKQLIETLKQSERYHDFTFFDSPVTFNQYFLNQEFDVVQIHDATPIGNGEDIIGFAGQCEWKNNKIAPLDGDSYTSQMPVIGYHTFNHNNDKCLDILVEEW